MTPSENDGHRQENDVARVASEETHELDDFGEAKNEDDLSPQSLLAAVNVPLSSTLPQSKDDEGVEEESQGREGRNVERIGAPWLLTIFLIG